jgi:hypothetical protein
MSDRRSLAGASLARNLNDLIEDRRRVLESEDLEKRVRALEQVPESED